MENMKKLRKEKRINQQGLATALRVSQSSISDYEKGTCLPSAINLIKMADFFECNTDYLLDRTQVKSRINDLTISNLSVEEAEMLAKFRKLSFSARNKIIGYVDAMLNS